MSDGSRHSAYSVKELTYGNTPDDPALALIRITGMTLGLTKDSLQSEEVRSDRQISDFRQGANQVGGDINFELSYGSFDNFLEGVLASSAWGSPATTGTTTLSATGTGYSRVTGNFLTDGFLVGQMVTASGFSGAGLNGKSIVTAVTALTMTTTPLTGTHGIEAGDADELIAASSEIKSGITRSSFSIVRHFADVAPADMPYYIYRGCEVNTLQLSISANAMVTGSFGIVGQSLELAEDLDDLGTPTFPTPSTTSPFDSFTGSLEEGGVGIAVVTEITMNLQNTLDPRFVVGSKNTIYPSIGRSNLTGQITAFFEDSTLVDKFISETESSLVFSLPDGAGNQQRYRIPRIKYTGGQPDVAGEGSVTLTMPFQALLDASEGTNLIIERTPA